MKNAKTNATLLGTLLVLITATPIAYAESIQPDTLRPIQDLHHELLGKFTPIEQPDGDVGINHSGEKAFTGDCDDYYTAAYNQLYRHGYDPYAQLMAVKANGKGHIVACVDIEGEAVCLDHNRRRTSTIHDLKRWYDLRERRNVVGN